MKTKVAKIREYVDKDYLNNQIIIKAAQFNGKNKFVLCELMKGVPFNMECNFENDDITFKTEQRTMIIRVGDYLLKDNKHEFFVFDPLVFESTFEELKIGVWYESFNQRR